MCNNCNSIRGLVEEVQLHLRPEDTDDLGAHMDEIAGQLFFIYAKAAALKTDRPDPIITQDWPELTEEERESWAAKATSARVMVEICTEVITGMVDQFGLGPTLAEQAKDLLGDLPPHSSEN